METLSRGATNSSIEDALGGIARCDFRHTHLIRACTVFCVNGLFQEFVVLSGDAISTKKHVVPDEPLSSMLEN